MTEEKPRKGGSVVSTSGRECIPAQSSTPEKPLLEEKSLKEEYEKLAIYDGETITEIKRDVITALNRTIESLKNKFCWCNLCYEYANTKCFTKHPGAIVLEWIDVLSLLREGKKVKG